MSVRAARGLQAFVFLLFSLIGSLTGQALAAGEARSIVTTQNSDYFGFDLRTEQNFSLDQCKTTCLGDPSCRAFTYNTKAKWCFLKSDFNQLKPFSGAVAGKVVKLSGEPDIGAPTELSYLPSWMSDEARLYRQSLTNGKVKLPAQGLGFLTDSAEQALLTGDARTAMQSYISAIMISPDDGALWTGLSRAWLALQPLAGESQYTFQSNATSAAWNGYQLSRTTSARADALRVIAQVLDRRDYSRPALAGLSGEPVAG